MANGMNRVFLLGNLGDDPELRHTENGKPYLRLRLATTEFYKDKNDQPQERTDWHTVQIWGKRAEALAKFLHKGERIMVEGKVETHSYEKDGQLKYFTQIRARDIYLTGKRPRPDNSDPIPTFTNDAVQPNALSGAVASHAGRKMGSGITEAKIGI